MTSYILRIGFVAIFAVAGFPALASAGLSKVPTEETTTTTTYFTDPETGLKYELTHNASGQLVSVKESGDTLESSGTSPTISKRSSVIPGSQSEN